MIYYFLSNVPAAVKIGGIFKGLALTEPLKLDLSFPSPFIEVCPEKNGYGAPLGFIAGPEFLSDPPERVTVTDLKGGYAVCFDFTRTEKDFKSIAAYILSKSHLPLNPHNIFLIFSISYIRSSIHRGNLGQKKTYLNL